MKERMTSLDLRAEVGNLQQLVGMRVSNIYDLSPKCFILKFAGTDRKVFLLMESGIRIHQTEFAREKPQAPSPFTSKVGVT
jgi:predicted ribosome quality control (RQC) complex YloA/Tae2 family protein